MQELRHKNSMAQLSTVFSTGALGTIARYFLADSGDYFPPGK
jgi:hypothetical protein